MPQPQTLTAKIVDAHRAPGDELAVRVDQVLIEDATGTMCALQFEELGAERSAVGLAVLYVDHNVLQIDERNAADHRYLRAFCSRAGVHYSKPGNGISHYVHLERFAVPGQVLVGADSHSSTAGAAGMLAVGSGGLEVAVAMAGHPFELGDHEVVGVELRGELPPWLGAKDVVLELLRRCGTKGGVGRILEFHGDGVAGLSVPERGTICNMVVELGATTGVFESDERTRAWLAEQEREEDFAPLAADPGVRYDEALVIELSELEPLVARPPSPGDVVPVGELAGTELAQVCVGSSVNSAFADLAIVGAVLDGQAVHPQLDLTVTPGSRQILDTLVRSGVFAQLAGAGARMLEPICGPCIGAGQAPPAGRASLRTFNRNFPGRSGTPGDEVYLCSPATAAASALTGEITDPRTLGRPPRRRPQPERLRIDDRAVLAPAPPGEAAGIEIPRPDTVVPPPPGRSPDDSLFGPVLIVVPDDVSTGDMAPDGALGMSVWSDIERCATHMFRRLDRDFHDRALEAGGGFVVGGENYGQGSSREHAALSALHLGVRAVLARSFARIHRRNLILVGILPLVLADPDDHGRLVQGEPLEITGVHAALRDAGEKLEATRPDGEDVCLRLALSSREREIVLAGGLLKALTCPQAGALQDR